MIIINVNYLNEIVSCLNKLDILLKPYFCYAFLCTFYIKTDS